MAEKKTEPRKPKDKSAAFEPPTIKKEGKLSRVIQDSGKVDLSMGRRN